MTDALVSTELRPQMDAATLALAIAYDVEQTGRPLLKHPFDLRRYTDAIRISGANVIVETGTWTGQSASWFASQPGVDLVLTIDIKGREWPERSASKICSFVGDSTNPLSVERFREYLDPSDRVLVSLDSGHTTDHVAAELELFAPLVSPGSFLVVEDTLHHFRPRFAASNPWLGLCQWRAEGYGYGFGRCIGVEGRTVTTNPGGWLFRT